MVEGSGGVGDEIDMRAAHVLPFGDGDFEYLDWRDWG